MQKDYTEWHGVKTTIEHEHKARLFREQEVWWCSLGENIGFEQDGKNSFFERPVLVLRKFNKELFWGVPMTSKKKEGVFYHSFFLHNEECTVILSQLRVLSAKRLVRRLGKMSDPQFGALEDAVVSLLKQTDPLRGPRVPNGNL